MTHETESATSSAVNAPSPAVDSWRWCVALSLLAVMLATQELSAARHANVPTSTAAWVAAPVVAVAIAVDPQIVRPTESLGDCDFEQRMLIANEVIFHRAHLVAISLLGGLYGP